MQILPTYSQPYQPNYVARAEQELNAREAEASSDKTELRKAFDQFVGQTFFSQLLSQMRKTVDKPAYFHGGRAEEVFQGQMDQLLTERLTTASAGNFSGPMFELFQLGRP